MPALYSLLASSLVLLSVVAPASTSATDESFIIAGYLPDYRAQHVGKHMAKVGPAVSDMILFSAVPTAVGGLAHTDSVFPVRKVFRRAKRLLLGLGGAGRSSAFPALCASADARSNLINNLLAVVTEHELAGVDFDWEAPGSEIEVRHYGLLLTETKAAFRKHGEARRARGIQRTANEMHGDLLVTVAMHDWQDLGTLTYEAVDRIHLMAYVPVCVCVLCGSSVAVRGVVVLYVAVCGSGRGSGSGWQWEGR